MAILANHPSVLAIARWGHEPDPALLLGLGLPAGRAPHPSTFQRLFAK